MAIVKKRAEATINRPADEIWAHIGDYMNIAWIPGSETARTSLEGNLRTVRREKWKDFKVVQRVVEHDNVRRRYSFDLPAPIDFTPLAGPGKIVNVLNFTLAVTPITETQSHVTWDLETEEFLAGGTFAEYQGALTALKATMEG
jgi:hypothetical protein